MCEDNTVPLGPIRLCKVPPWNRRSVRTSAKPQIVQIRRKHLCCTAHTNTQTYQLGRWFGVGDVAAERGGLWKEDGRERMGEREDIDEWQHLCVFKSKMSKVQELVRTGSLLPQRCTCRHAWKHKINHTGTHACLITFSSKPLYTPGGKLHLRSFSLIFTGKMLFFSGMR